MEELYDENGNLIPAEQRVTSGTSTTNSASQTQTVSGTARKSQSEEKKRKMDILAGQDAITIPDPGPYQKQPYVESPRFADMIRIAEENKAKRLASNLTEQDRERRKGRYLAWTDFGKALGGVAGMGYAPAEKQDTRRALESYAKLDELRKDYDAIDSADNLSWIQKLALQTQLQHDVQEQARFDAREKERQRIEELNYRFKNAKVGSETEGSKQSSGNVIVNIDSSTIGNKTTQNESTTDVLKNPDWLALEQKVKGMASFNKPLTSIDRNNDFEITTAEGWDMIAQFRKLADDIKNGRAVTDGDYYVTNKGVRIPKAGVDQELEELRNLADSISGKFGSSEDSNRTALEGLVKSIDLATGYAFRKYFDGIRGSSPAGYSPLSGWNGGGTNKPTFSFKNTAKPKLI